MIEENPRMEHIDVKAAEVIRAVTKTPVRIEKGAEHINMCRAIQAGMSMEQFQKENC